MENTIAKNIIYYAYNRTKQHEVAKALGYSTKQLTRICKAVFNRTYKQFQRELIFSTILERIRDCNTPQSIADEFFNGNVHQLYAYVKSFLNVPPKQISTKGVFSMTKKLTIEGMMCSHCTGRVEKALSALEGVSSVVMDLEGKSATVTLSADLSDALLTQTVTDANGQESIKVVREEKVIAGTTDKLTLIKDKYGIDTPPTEKKTQP